ncbi:MAG: histidine phosphatase family protein [Clostridia bacterium]|nr:histidine phosphatase family protein [Clostridia bacterium]
MLLYIIRHGDPDYTTDTLTERGLLQAEAVGKRLEKAGIDEIYSSPMGRARQTAEPLCRKLGLEMKIEEWSHEVQKERLTTYPDGVAKSVSLLQNTYLRENGEIDIPYDRTFETKALKLTDMESAFNYIKEGGRDFLARLGYEEEKGVYRIVRKNENKVALFCHSVLERVWLSHLLHIPLHIMWGGFLPTHTGVTILEFKNNENLVTAPKCLVFSDMGHLYKEGLDTIHDNKWEL